MQILNDFTQVVQKCGHALEGEGIKLHDKGTIICMGTVSHLHSYGHY